MRITSATKIDTQFDTNSGNGDSFVVKHTFDNYTVEKTHLDDGQNDNKGSDHQKVYDDSGKEVYSAWYDPGANGGKGQWNEDTDPSRTKPQ